MIMHKTLRPNLGGQFGHGAGSVGAKAFSYNGLDWNYTTESMDDVYDCAIEYTDGSIVDFSRREEPKLYVENGQMLAIFNAVQDLPSEHM